MTEGRRELHTLVGAYALDALEAGDRASFEAHLVRCESCTRELVGFRETAARLALAAAAPPPALLQHRVEGVVSQTRQLPPAGVSHRVESRRRRALRPHGAQRRVARTRPVVRAAAFVIAGLLTGSVVGYFATQSTSPRGNAFALRDHQIAAVLTAHDAKKMSAHVRGGGTATIVMSRDKHALVFAASGLKALPHSKCYEIWLMGRTGATSAEVLPAPVHGMTGPVVASHLEGKDRHLGLTVEPRGGSARPTSGMVLVIVL